MKDSLQRYLESECIRQQWVKNHLSKKIVVPKVINLLSISSVRQIIELRKTKNLDGFKRII